MLQAYVWGKGPPAAVEQAIVSSSLNAYFPSSIDTFLRDPSVLLATRTYSFMRTIAIAAAVLVLLGLLLYLQARQRSQVIASALARRMGFGARGEALSVSLEVLAILAFAALVGAGIAIVAAGPVVRHIDPLPQDAPAPIFTLPLGRARDRRRLPRRARRRRGGADHLARAARRPERGAARCLTPRPRPLVSVSALSKTYLTAGGRDRGAPLASMRPSRSARSRPSWAPPGAGSRRF